MVLPVLWILSIVVTGFRIVERDLLLSAEHRYYARHNVILTSVLHGVMAALATMVLLMLAAGCFYLLEPNTARQAWVLILALLSRWLPITPQSLMLIAVTFILVTSWVAAPPLTSAVRGSMSADQPLAKS